MDGLKVQLFELLTDIGVADVLANLIVTVSTIILWIFIALIANMIVKRVIYRILNLSDNNARATTVGKLISSVIKYVVWFIVSIVVLSELDIDVTPFIASAGVIGLAIGFGAQEIVRDFISGFFIIFEGSFNVGDVIEVDGFKGNVLGLGLRTTSIQNWKNEIKIINNGDIKSLINFSKTDSIAIVDFGVAYETDLSKLSNLMEKFEKTTFNKYDEIIELPVFLGVIELADSSINLRIIAKTGTLKHFQVERDIRKDLVIYLNDNDIDIPFPQIVVRNHE